MRCKAGDLAVIVAPGSEWDGAMVSVHAAAPMRRFLLPDGHSAIATKPDMWLCESLGRPFVAPLTDGTARRTRWGVIADRNLRPLRDPGPDAIDETLSMLSIAPHAGMAVNLETDE